MHDIYHTFIINAPGNKVFDLVSTGAGLNKWWTKGSIGEPAIDSIYDFDFGPEYKWQAVVTKYEPHEAFEFTMTVADADWLGTKVGFLLNVKDNHTEVSFYHTGWPESNEHYKISCYCWAMYLRILKRYLEHNETVPYEERLSA